MFDRIHLQSIAKSIESNFDLESIGYDRGNPNPLDLINGTRDISCAARTFVIATAMEQLIGDEYSVQFAFHQRHKTLEADGKLSEFARKKPSPRMYIAHARVEIGDGSSQPYSIDPEFTENYQPVIDVKSADHPRYNLPGPRFDDHIEGMRAYCLGHTSFDFELNDIDTAHEILMSRDFSENLQLVA